MTILDKGEIETNKKDIKKKKNTKKKKSQIKYKIMSFLLIIFTVSMFGIIVYHGLLSLYTLLPIIVVSLVVVFFIAFILNKRRLRAWIKNIFFLFSLIIIFFEIIMMLYGAKTLKFLTEVTDTGYRVETYGVYVINDNYQKLNSLDGKTITYLNHEDDKNIREALGKIEKKIKVNNDYEDTFEELINVLKEGETDAILVERAYEDLMRDEFADIYKKMDLIEEVDIVDKVDTIKSSKDITKDPFILYISGTDTSGNILSKCRSDVNILVAINPKTHNILFLNTPRDFYVTLASKGKPDKLTHAGLYGVEESLNTLAGLYGVEVDYFVRVNFTSFLKIVNALGGIKVNVPKNFCEQNSDRSFAKGDLICLNKGVQTLNGEQALALARHRKTIGDRKRGENQMMVLEAIMNKAMSPKILTKYDSLIAALEGRVSTNMTTNEMYKFSKRQLKNGANWNFSSISVTGKDSSAKAYSTGNLRVSIIDPDLESVEKAKTALNNLLSGKEDVLEGLQEK